MQQKLLVGQANTRQGPGDKEVPRTWRLEVTHCTYSVIEALVPKESFVWFFFFKQYSTRLVQHRFPCATALLYYSTVLYKSSSVK